MSDWSYEYGTLWATMMEAGVPVAVQPRVPAVIGEVPDQDLDLLAQAMGLSSSEPVLRRLAGRRRCFAAWIDEQIAAYGWVSQEDEWIGEQERCIQISKKEAYIWDCFTLPHYRRQRLYSALLSQMLSVLKHEGLQRTWIGTALKNRASIKGFAKVGFRPVINLLYLRLFNRRAWWLKSHASAPEFLVEAARQALIRNDEHTWGPLVIGSPEARPMAGCAQVEG